MFLGEFKVNTTFFYIYKHTSTYNQLMLKNKALLIISIIFFLLLNTRYYWEGVLGAWAMLEVIILILTFIILFIALIYQIFLAIKEKLTVKSRTILIAIMSATLGTDAIKPHGLIDFEKFEHDDLLIAGRKGVAGCMTTLKLKVNNEFYIKSVCLGLTRQLELIR